MIRLADVEPCFEGIVPAAMATCAADGTPNVSYISHVQRVDDRHVALSHQFFNKTRANLLVNPHACVEVVDPTTSRAFKLRLRYDHEETSGPLYEAMALRIVAIASMTGMEKIFRLLAADVFEVVEIEEVDVLDPDSTVPAGPPVLPPPSAFHSMCGLRALSERINRADDLDDLLGTVLEVMEGVFGFRHAMVLLPDDTGERLVAVASRGYPTSGAGAEVRVGEGVIGTVARARRLLRLTTVDCHLRYARSVGDATREIPLPGLPDAGSQLAVPLLVQDELVGVLAVESRRPLDFGPDDETFLSIVANHVAFALKRMLERDDDGAAARPRPAARPAPERRRREFCFYVTDDCVFVDGQYLIRNLPGRILWKLLQRHRAGQKEFSNRELRLDGSLGLPPIKDNLESRLLLLRRRLEEKCPDVRMVPTARGRFALELLCDVELIEKSA